MSAGRICPECGNELPPGVAPWLCPECLLRQAADKSVAVEPAASPALVSKAPGSCGAASEALPQLFGGYELLERVGQGGMGLVYRARQISLDRCVAVKVLPLGALATKDQVHRFRTEAAAAGCLQHPNIVAIHEVGLCENRHYLVMDFVEGRTVAELARAGPLPPARAAQYLRKIAQAIHHAHERGILHRDLKPSNVIVDAADEPRITDFGLAKRLESGTDLTLSGQVLGSPHYMPPEQAAGRPRQVGRRSDVYALGAVLYHLLTGRPPFPGETLAEVLPQVLNNEPLRPRQLNPAVPVDLETVCLKCLEKEMHRRYPSALALAEELGRFLRAEPILARPVGVTGKTWRWCRRNPRNAIAIGAVALSLALGLAGVGWQWRRAERQRLRAEANEYVLSINVAQQAINAHNTARALELLKRYQLPKESKVQGAQAEAHRSKSQVDPRGFEWHYLWQQCQTEAEAVIGKLELAVRALDVSSDGHWLFAGATRSPPKVWNLDTGELLPWVSKSATWGYGAFSPDSRFLLLADQGPDPSLYGTISVWDLKTRQKVTPIVDGRPIGPMFFSADGQRFGYGVIAQTGLPGLVVLNFATREKIFERIAERSTPDTQKGYEGVFARDGLSVIGSLGGSGREIAIQDLTPGSKLRLFPAHQEEITTMAISSDGRMLATGAGYTETIIKLWEVPSLQPLGELPGHKGWITALKFSPDGLTLASAAADQSVRLWDLPTRKPRRILDRLPADVWRLCFSSNGRELFTGSADGNIQRWSVALPSSPFEPSFARRATGLAKVSLAPDARRFAGLRQGGVCWGDVEGAGAPIQLPELGTNNTCLLFSRDGQLLFAGTDTGEIQVKSLAGPEPPRRLRTGVGRLNALLRDEQDGLLLALAVPGQTTPDQPGPLRIETMTRAQAWSLAEKNAQPPFLISGWWGVYALSPDGRWLVADHDPGTLQVRTLFGPARTGTLSFLGRLRGLAFSPDGRFLAAATSEGAVKVWETPRFLEKKEFRASAHALSALAFSPDSRRLATAGSGVEAIKLWDVPTWQELITLACEDETVLDVGFSSDGKQLAAKGSKGDLLFWRVP